MNVFYQCGKETAFASRKYEWLKNLEKIPGCHGIVSADWLALFCAQRVLNALKLADNCYKKAPVRNSDRSLIFVESKSHKSFRQWLPG
jgi:hypothetical protein